MSLNKKLQAIIEKHQHGVSRYVTDEQLKSMDAGATPIVKSLRDEVFAECGLPEDNVVFTAHIIEDDEEDGIKIIAVTADSKKYYRDNF